MIQTLTLDFTGKISGSVTENPNIAKKNGVEFTQQQYDLIFSNELRVSETDILEFEFPVPTSVQTGLTEVGIFFKAKMDNGEVELRSSDKGVYGNSTTLYQQKLLQIYKVDIVNNTIKFNMKSTGKYGVYEVKCNVLYDDNGMNSYSGNYTYTSGSGVNTTVTIDRKKLEEIITSLEGLPTNSLSYVTFAQVGTEEIK